MYKKILTVVKATTYTPSGQTKIELLAVYISSKKVWEGTPNRFTGYVVLDLVEGVKSYFEVRHKEANPAWFREQNLMWPDSLKEVVLV